MKNDTSKYKYLRQISKYMEINLSLKIISINDTSKEARVATSCIKLDIS